MRNQLTELFRLGRIPDDALLSDELFQKYEDLFSGFDSPVTWEEAELLVTLFSEENLEYNWDLDWGLLHLIETVPLRNMPEEIGRYKNMISRCPNPEFQELMKIRLDNWIKNQKQQTE
ncbi:MAG: hypothetical protein IJ642_04760 [Oscillospiraceae bacterium]|nr:hypothetical protein [Oscillospiraceae bacterium]